MTGIAEWFIGLITMFFLLAVSRAKIQASGLFGLIMLTIVPYAIGICMFKLMGLE